MNLQSPWNAWWPNGSLRDPETLSGPADIWEGIVAKINAVGVNPNSIEGFFLSNLIRGAHLLEAYEFLENMNKTWDLEGALLTTRQDILCTYPLKIINSPNNIMQLRSNLLEAEQQDPEMRKLKERLLNSLYPWQVRDFFFLTVPFGHDGEGQEVPVDWALKNLVLFLWSNGIYTGGWDQGYPGIKFDKDQVGKGYFGYGFINVSFLKTGIIERGFVEENGRIVNGGSYLKKIKGVNDMKAVKTYIRKLKDVFTPVKEIVLKLPPADRIQWNNMWIHFNYDDLPIIHKKFNIQMPNYDDSEPGSVIPIGTLPGHSLPD